jgi:hypothetical protein
MMEINNLKISFVVLVIGEVDFIFLLLPVTGLTKSGEVDEILALFRLK